MCAKGGTNSRQDIDDDWNGEELLKLTMTLVGLYLMLEVILEPPNILQTRFQKPNTQPTTTNDSN